MAIANHLNVDRELLYIVQWFTEWSELQRDDFLPILVECLAHTDDGPVILNGIMSGMASTGFSDKPMSLFQCRVKLFREWSAKWPAAIRHSLHEKVQLIDAEYGERVGRELQLATTTTADHGTNNGAAAAVNGFASIAGLDGGETNESLDDRVLSQSIPVQNEPVLA